MVAVPAETPLTTPVEEPTVATAVLLLLQVVVPDASPSVVEPPTHSVRVPVIAAGSGFMVTAAVVKHPVGNV